MNDLPASASVGQVVDGKYRVERVIGAGGMGVVVAAEHLKLGKLVALKFLLKQACDNPEAVSRFLREGRALAQITSAHVARVMDVGTLEQGEPYLVLEYLEGMDLGALLKQRGRLPVIEAVGYVLQAAEAVAEAHANGIIHRDLKPSNLFLTQGADGEALIKVLDFGISKALQPKAIDASRVDADATTAAGTHDTNTGALVGSPLYMSPEQIRSARHVDERTDIWGFGVVLYELLCARRPFRGETLAGALAAVAADPPEPISALRSDVPAELQAIVLRCLEKSPEQRFKSLASLARALMRFASPDARTSVDRIERMLGASARRGGNAAHAESESEERAATVPTWEGDAVPLAASSSVLRRRLPLLLGLAILALSALALTLVRAPQPAPAVSAAAHQPSVTAPLPSLAPEPQPSALRAAVAEPKLSEPPPKPEQQVKPARSKLASGARPAPSASTRATAENQDGTADRK